MHEPGGRIGRCCLCEELRETVDTCGSGTYVSLHIRKRENTHVYWPTMFGAHDGSTMPAVAVLIVIPFPGCTEMWPDPSAPADVPVTPGQDPGKGGQWKWLIVDFQNSSKVS